MAKTKRGGPLKGVIKGVIADLGKRRIAERDMVAVWRSVVGKRASSHARPAAFKKGRFVVNVDGSAWLYELTLKKKEILKKLEQKLEGKKIREVRFRIGEVE